MSPAVDPTLGAESPIAAEATRQSSRLWLWFVAAFVLQLAAWTAWFVIASQHKVQEVPLSAAAPARAPAVSGNR
jgi:hypothetical protein